MKSFTGKFTSVRGWALLLALPLGAGMMITACGDEEVPAPTTPAPTPPPAPPPAPEPEPEPEPPAVPTGLRVSATGMDFIEWSWTPVEDVSGYDVQFSANEAFTDEDEIIARTAEEISYRKDGLEAGTSAYLRVRSATGADDDRVTSDWSTHVTGMTMEAPPPPEPPATPTGLMVSESTETSITWSWNAVAGALGYVVQVSTDEMFDDAILGNAETVLFDGLPFTTETSYTAADLDADTTLYVRVAAAAGTPTAPLVSAFTTHATGMTMAATLGAPANVRVKSKGSNHIEWEWDEVAGADGYQAHFSTDSGFSDPNNFEIRGGSSTTQRVANLDAESDGYFRVRAYSGTVTARMFGDWSEASMATTEEPPPPPPAEPLEAPANVGTSNAQDNSITVSWDEVDDAEEYAVRQRSNGGAWVDASCGSETAGNIVTDTSCVASGLDEDTPYDFQVRAFPDEDDDTLTQSAWSDIASGETTGEAPPPPITSGGDELNVEWTSTATTATWNWDPVENREDRSRIDHWACMANTAVDSPAASACEVVPGTEPAAPATGTTLTDNAWANLGKNISASAGGTVEAGQIRTLRIVRTWMEELGGGLEVRRFGTPVVVMAATSPTSATASNPRLTESTTRLEPVRIEWVFEVDPGFTYPGTVLSVSRDDDLPAATSDNPCSGGKSVASPQMSGRPNVDVRHREALSVADAYKQLRFCARAENGDGASAWTIIGTDGVQTIPGTPSTPSYDSGGSEFDSDDTGSHIVTRVAWSVAERAQTPSEAGATGSKNYAVKAFRSSKTSATTDVCELTADSADYTLISSPTPDIEDSLGGTQVTLTGTIAADLLGDEGIGTYYLYACVRATPMPARADAVNGGSLQTTDHGPWAIGRSISFRRALGASRLSSRNLTGNTEAELTWSAVNGADTYTVYSVASDAADATRAGASAVGTCSNIANTAERTCTVTRPANGSADDYYWVEATAAVSGSSLTTDSNRVTVADQPQ